MRAYNNNMPFDQFSILQLAGDLLAETPLEQRILAGFNRNNGTTDEGGAIAEEYRVEYAVDRVKTTSTVWMGLTMECAQCHDHKYDPITQEEYYKFFAFLTSVRTKACRRAKATRCPPSIFPIRVKQQKLPGVQAKLASARKSLNIHREKCELAFEQWLADAEFTLGDDDKLPDDAIAQFLLDENKGRKVIAANNKKLKGTINGKEQWVKTKRGYGLRFNGKNYVDLGTSPTLSAINLSRTAAGSSGQEFTWRLACENGSRKRLSRIRCALR